MPDVFVDFYDRHYRLVLTVAQQRLGGLTDAEDVTAEVFRITWSHYQDTGELGLPWVYQTLRNVVGNEYRRRGRAPYLTVDLEGLGHSTGHLDALPEEVAVRREMAELEESDREVLFMAYWEDLTPREMSRILGCSLAAVRVRLFRARRRLEKRLVVQELGREGSA